MTSHTAKIPVLFLHAQTFFGADSTIHAHLMRHLDRRRFEVHIACPRVERGAPSEARERLASIPDVHVRPTAFVPGFRERTLATVAKTLYGAYDFPLEYAALAHYIRHHGIRIVHSTDRPRDSAYAVSLGRLTGAKSIVHVHVKWSAGYSRLARWAVRTADAVFGVSAFVSESVVAEGRAKQAVHTVLNAVEPALWDPSQHDGAAIRAEFGIASGAPLLVAVSRLFGEKGHPELLEALVRVRARFRDVRLLIVGDETPFSVGFAAEMKALSVRLGVADAVVFAGPRTDVADVMAACDVFTLPSYEEPFGLVYLEAMAMERPVIAVANGGAPEVVEHGLSGLLSPYKNVAALAANICTLLADPALRARMGAHGRRRVLAYFNTQRMAEDVARAYELVLTPPAG